MRVTVVGAGVVGLACAWELAQRGADVTVREAGAVGGGVSRGNAGWICPTITAPLAAPGMVREGLHQLLHRRGAFRIHPRLDPTFVRWLWTFRAAATPARYEAGTRALQELNRRTMELYDRYRAQGVLFELHRTGLVIAAHSQDGLAPYRRLAALLGEDVAEVDGAAAAELEPALDGNRVAGALVARIDRHVRPESLLSGLTESLRALGATIQEHSPVRSVDELDADRIVVAAGLGTARLVPLRVPLVGAAGYSTTVAGTGAPPRHALYLPEAKLALSPYADGVRVAGVLELGARTARARPESAGRLLAAAAPYLRGWRPNPAEAATAWAGLRPAIADGLPLIGPVPGRPDVFVAAGHGMLGVTLAPATAAALAPFVLQDETSDVLAPFALSR